MFNPSNSPFAESTSNSSNSHFFDDPILNSIENLLKRKTPESPCLIQQNIYNNLASYCTLKKDFEAILSIPNQFPDLGPNHEWSPSFQALTSKFDKSSPNYEYEIRKNLTEFALEDEEENLSSVSNGRAEIMKFLENEAGRPQISLDEELKEQIFNGFEEKQRNLAEKTVPFLFSIPTSYFKAQKMSISKRRDGNIEISQTEDGCTVISYLKRRAGSRSDVVC